MPELPEVETTLRGIRPYLEGRKIHRLDVRERRLRWTIEDGLEKRVRNQTVRSMQRRGKYLLLYLDDGGLLMHLGMSGSFRVLETPAPPQTHDHYDLVCEDGTVVRYRDPRKFGALLWSPGDPSEHLRVRSLGVEPLGGDFDGEHLYLASRNRKAPVKSLLMNARVVVGVGNIYASEALFDAGIHPVRQSRRISRHRYGILVGSVRRILCAAIDKGGTTLKDFSSVNGQSGYFEQDLAVYGRAGENCIRCGAHIRRVVVGQRSTFYCPGCQH